MNIRQIIGVGVSAVFVTSNLTPAQAQIHHQVRQEVKARQVIQMTPKQYALDIIRKKGWGLSGYKCLINIGESESHWNPKAKNPRSTAFGIGQLLTETSHDPATQVRNFIHYLEYRYPSKNPACTGWRFHMAHGYY